MGSAALQDVRDKRTTAENPSYLTAVNRDLLLSEDSVKFTIQRLQIVPNRERLTECRDQLTETYCS